MKKTFSLTLVTLFLMFFSFVIFPIKVFANSIFDGTADDWFNHISQYDYEYGLARAEIYQTEEEFSIGFLIVEEPYHEFEGCMFEYILSHQSEDWNYIEPYLRSALRSEYLYDPTRDINELIEGWYGEYFDGYLYWNFEEGYWQVLYYGITELDYYKQRVEDLEDEIQQLEEALASEYDRGYNEGYNEGYEEIQQLENENQQLENEIQQLEYEKQQLEYENQQLEDEIQQLEYEIQQLEEEIQQLEYEKQQLENEIQQLEYEKQQLEGEIQQLENENSLLRDEIQQLEDEISLLQNEIQQLEEVLNTEYDRGYNEGYEVGYNEGLLVENNNDITKWFVPLVVIIIIVGIIEPIIILKRRG